jgi:RNase adaptor protein for sRNA GlmZ degradation
LQKDFFSNDHVNKKYNEIKIELKTYINENKEKEEIKIAIGCEKGKHRSVSFVEKISIEFENDGLFVLDPIHRDINNKHEKVERNGKKKMDFDFSE